jgi:hypothetical protein
MRHLLNAVSDSDSNSDTPAVIIQRMHQRAYGGDYCGCCHSCVVWSLNLRHWGFKIRWKTCATMVS